MRNAIKFGLVVMALVFANLASGKPPSSKKVELDVLELSNQQLAGDRRLRGLLEYQSAKVLSAKEVTEDRQLYTVRLVKVRNSRPLPPPTAIDPPPPVDIQALALVPANTKATEDVEVLFRLRAGEWRMDNVKTTSVDVKEFEAALRVARSRLR
jgi:hypothetical protein